LPNIVVDVVDSGFVGNS